MSQSFHDGRVQLYRGDCREILRGLSDDSVDSVVTDPPYALTSTTKRWGNTPRTESTMPKVPVFARTTAGFMGQRWDNGETAFDPEFWRDVLRVLKPGGYVAAMGGDRTVHRLACAIEDAGLEIRGQCAWIFGSGFPKSRNVSADLLSLPRCSCGGGKIAVSRTKLPIPAPENTAALNACADVFSNISRGSDRADVCVDARPPFSNIGTTDRTEFLSSPANGSAATEARGFGNKLRRRSGHRGAAKDQGIKEDAGNLNPVVLGSPDMAVVTERNQVALNIGVVELKPEPLRDDVMGNEPIDGPTVSTEHISGDNACGDLAPTIPLVRPTPPSPRGVVHTTQATGVGSGHTPATTVGAGFPADEIAGAKVSRAVLTSEDRHDSIYSAFRCENCGGVIASKVPAGLGTALKPAMELVILARKPLIGTVAANVLKHSVGALNVDGCRVETSESLNGGAYSGDLRRRDQYTANDSVDGASTLSRLNQGAGEYSQPVGRWPANVIHDGSEEVVGAFPETASGANGLEISADQNRTAYGSFNGGERSRAYDANSGSAARFFYSAKADHNDRMGSSHPTVKPLDLMQYLVRLITPKNGVCLDPFAGTGTTGEAALREGMRAILIEREPEYQADIVRRMKHVFDGEVGRSVAIAKARSRPSEPMSLFPEPAA